MVELNPMLWLAIQVGKLSPSHLFGSACFDSMREKKFVELTYKVLIKFWTMSSMELPEKKYLGQYPAILISCLQISKAGIPQMAGFKINMRKK